MFRKRKEIKGRYELTLKKRGKKEKWRNILGRRKENERQYTIWGDRE